MPTITNDWGDVSVEADSTNEWGDVTFEQSEEPIPPVKGMISGGRISPPPAPVVPHIEPPHTPEPRLIPVGELTQLTPEQLWSTQIAAQRLDPRFAEPRPPEPTIGGLIGKGMEWVNRTFKAPEEPMPAPLTPIVAPPTVEETPEAAARRILASRVHRATHPVSSGIGEVAEKAMVGLAQPAGPLGLLATAAAPAAAAPIWATLAGEASLEAIPRIQKAREEGNRADYYASVSDLLLNAGILAGSAKGMFGGRAPTPEVAELFKNPGVRNAVDEAINAARKNGPSPEFRSFFGGIDPEIVGTTAEKVSAFARSIGMEWKPVPKAGGEPPAPEAPAAPTLTPKPKGPAPAAPEPAAPAAPSAPSPSAVLRDKVARGEPVTSEDVQAALRGTTEPRTVEEIEMARVREMPEGAAGEAKLVAEDIAKAVDTVNVDDVAGYSPVPALVRIIRKAPRDPAMKTAAEQAMQKIGQAAREQGVPLEDIKAQIADELKSVYGSDAAEMAKYYFGETPAAPPRLPGRPVPEEVPLPPEEQAAAQAVELTEPIKADVVGDPRLVEPGVTSRAKPNSIVVQLRDLESRPVREVVLESTGDPLADSKLIAGVLGREGGRGGISLRESSAVSTGPKGLAIYHFGNSPRGVAWTRIQDLIEARKPAQNWKNLGEGPWDTYEDALEFAENEVGVDYRISQRKNGKWIIETPVVPRGQRKAGPPSTALQTSTPTAIEKLPVSKVTGEVGLSRNLAGGVKVKWTGASGKEYHGVTIGKPKPTKIGGVDTFIVKVEEIGGEQLVDPFGNIDPHARNIVDLDIRQLSRDEKNITPQASNQIESTKPAPEPEAISWVENDMRGADRAKLIDRVSTTDKTYPDQPDSKLYVKRVYWVPEEVGGRGSWRVDLVENGKLLKGEGGASFATAGTNPDFAAAHALATHLAFTRKSTTGAAPMDVLNALANIPQRVAEKFVLKSNRVEDLLSEQQQIGLKPAPEPPATGAAPSPFFPRRSEALGLGEPALPPTVEDVRRQRAIDREGVPPPAETGPAESRIPRPATTADIFAMSDTDLRDFLEGRFPEPPSTGPATGAPARRVGTYEFPTYDEFRDWMDARYGEFDLEGMKLAFAEASTANKIAYIKGNKAPGHKSDWIRHLATGSPLPATNPPVPRTTPRPMPGGGTSPPAGAPPSSPAYPSPPPPPPRAASVHPKFDITALVQLLRQFGKFPVINQRIRSAYGRFVPDRELVELKQRLLWDTKLSERVLGHEIGHFIDLIIPLIGKGKQFGQRLRLLTDFTGQVWRSKELRADAKSLSRQWRGSFPDGDSYRDTAKELIADFMSAMFNNPEWVNQNYPRLYDAFSEFRTAKPQFDSAYREIETWLQGGTVVNELLAQDKAAVNRTFDILTKQEPKRPIKERIKLMGDSMSAALVSLWGRAFQKEGKPRLIGESITEKLETSYMWSAKKTALWTDDYTKNVQPHLDRVSSDPAEAHAALLAYSKAVRTIGERRAAGVWIEQNPVEAREMLKAILDMHAPLRDKFGPALDGASDPELYDLAAAIFREVHDGGERFVNRVAREIDALNLGVNGESALIAFNVRGKLLNPGGLTPATAQRMIAHLRDQLGPDKFSELEAAARGLRSIMAGVQREMYDAGLISRNTWENLIEPNTDNYLPFAVLDYFDGRVSAGVMPQKGTALDVADISAATQLKVGSAYTWLQRQRQVQLLRDIYSATGPMTVGDPLRRASDIWNVRTRGKNATDDVSRAAYWVNGRPHVVEFYGDPGKMLEKALELPEFYQHVEWLHNASKFTHGLMQFFTTFNPRFLFYRNVVRGFRTAGLKVGYGRAIQQMGRANVARNLRLARNYADAAFGGEMLPEVRRMVELEALPPPRIAVGAVRDLPNMRELLVRGALPIFGAKHLKGLVPEKPQGLVRRVPKEIGNFLDRAFTTYEAFEKIYNYYAALEGGLAEHTASAIAQRGGIPRPGVAGKWSSAAEIMFPWTRVKFQGLRSTYQMMRDPRFRKGFATRFALFEALPRMAKVLTGIGLAGAAISWLMRKDEDKEDPVSGEVARRVSPYKMALDDVVPFVFYDSRTGKYHPFWKFKRGKDVPKHFEVVSLRIPSSEEGQTFGNALYNAMISMPGVRDKLGKPGQDLVNSLGDAAKSFGPELSPIITSTSDLMKMILSGHNPDDPWKGSPSANPQLFDAGGTDRAQAIAGYIMNKAGGPGEAAGILAANAGLLDERALQALSYRIEGDKRPWTEKFPFLTTAVAHDNYGQYREEKTQKLSEIKERAQARLVMPGELTKFYDFYYRNLNRQDKLDPHDSMRFRVASIFVNDIWGSSKDVGTFYNSAMHAVGPDGSKQAKETVRRDMMNASESLLAAWETIKP